MQALIIALVFCLIGNYWGDQKTIKDCASTSNAVMMGGGTLKCEVIKENAK